MAIPSLIVVDEVSYALDLLSIGDARVTAIGNPDFIESIIGSESNHNILGYNAPPEGSWKDLGIAVGRMSSELVLIDWSLFYGELKRLPEFLGFISLIMDFGYRIAVVVREAATDELELPAHVIEFFLGQTPEIYHSEF